jgi:hypothetical protein
MATSTHTTTAQEAAMTTTPHRITRTASGFVSTVQTPAGQWEVARYIEREDDFIILGSFGRCARALMVHNAAVGR